MGVEIRIGDCRELLCAMPDESVHCIVTSPPYWGLRDYGVDGQMGLERSLGEHIEAMVSVFDECRRVLRKDGTCWINYGDCYATSPNGRSAADTKAVGNDDRTFRDKPFSTVGGVLKPKDLCMVPNRLAIALQEAGWWIRSEIIWAKPNPMPESVTDRPATSHEKIWMLTKSARYFYDAESVREPLAETSIPRLLQDIDAQEGSSRAHGGTKNMKAVGGVRRAGAHPTSTLTGGLSGRHETPEKYPKSERRGKGNAKGFRGGSYVNGEPGPRTQSGNEPNESGMRNCRNLWNIATKPFSQAHFATFPPELAERCIKAGCPSDGIVLDPFGGAGTTALVADRLQRHAILMELNPEYAAMAERRIKADAGMFAEVA